MLVRQWLQNLRQYKGDFGRISGFLRVSVDSAPEVVSRLALLPE